VLQHTLSDTLTLTCFLTGLKNVCSVLTVGNYLTIVTHAFAVNFFSSLKMQTEESYLLCQPCATNTGDISLF